MARRAAAPQRGGFRKLQRRAFRRARLRGLIGPKPELAIDATGLDSRHTSRHYARRRGKRYRVRHFVLLADKAYDAEHNHELARDQSFIRSTVIPLNRRGRGRKWPATKYRRQMRRRFPRRKYGQRWQAESVSSRHKRLDDALRSRSPEAQERECRLRVLTHNVMILAA